MSASLIAALSDCLPKVGEPEVAYTVVALSDLRAAIAALAAAPEQAEPAPSSWEMVPVEPTRQMLRDGFHAGSDKGHPAREGSACPSLSSAWDAMLAAAPPAPVPIAQPQPQPLTVPAIDYQALIEAAFKRTRAAQGTARCVAFKAGAEWFRDIVLAGAAGIGAQEQPR